MKKEIMDADEYMEAESIPIETMKAIRAEHRKKFKFLREKDDGQSIR